jgi:hypothetical protein
VTERSRGKAAVVIDASRTVEAEVSEDCTSKTPEASVGVGKKIIKVVVQKREATQNTPNPELTPHKPRANRL